MGVIHYKHSLIISKQGYALNEKFILGIEILDQLFHMRYKIGWGAKKDDPLLTHQVLLGHIWGASQSIQMLSWVTQDVPGG